MLNIAIVGNSNVGKTSLFNFLTGTNFSFSNKFKYFTLDYNYGFLSKNNDIINKNIIFIDTNSILKFIFFNNKKKYYNDNFLLNLKKKFLFIIKNVDFIFFLIDSRIITDKDKYLSRYLIKYNKNIILLLTKKDLNNNFILSINHFYCLKIKYIFYISIYDDNSIFIFLNKLFNKKKIISKNKKFYIKNIKFCINLDKNYYILNKLLFKNYISNYNFNKKIIKFVILGKPNTGKSSFLNLICKNNRSFISETYNYTKDFIMSLYKYNKDIYYLISDSPALYKNNYYYNDIILITKLNFNIILYIIDYNLGISKFDLKILNFFFKEGKYILLLFNKCDNINYRILLKYKNILIKRYDFMKYMDIYFFSYLKNDLNIINSIYKTIYLNYLNIFCNNISNFKINNILKFFNKNNKKYIFNLKHALICKYYPLIIIIYGNKINLINNSYKKKLLNFYMKELNFKGFKIFLKFKEIYNPYKKINK